MSVPLIHQAQLFARIKKDLLDIYLVLVFIIA